jgi:tetratricopeptide (TPR) repeat protein
MVACSIAWLLTACEPRGPRALLEGERFVKEERFNEAIGTLLVATENLPREARAWNLLGLAYHGAGMDTEAAQAYGRSLTLDSRLSAARFNLGCLLLEQGQPQQAVNELTAFTLVQPKSVAGWLRLASAHYRLNKLDAAEAAYRTVLTLTARQPEALNGLGCIAVSRRRYVDAVQYFQAALVESPGYATPLLNQAIVTHRFLNQRSTALQKYRQYMALQPRPDHWDIAYQASQTLAEELSAGTRSPLLASATNLVTRPIPGGMTATNGSGAARGAAPTNSDAAGASPLRPAPARDLRPTSPSISQATNPPAATPSTVTPAAAPPPAVSSNPAPKPAPAPREVEPPPPAIVVAEVPRDIQFKPAQEITNPVEAERPPAPPSPSSPEAATRQAPSAVRPAAAPAKEERSGFFARLNPFRSRTRTEPPPPPAVVSATPAAPIAPPAATRPEPSLPAATPPAGNYKRYAYRPAGRPVTGDRPKAVELVNKGILAHRERKPEEEVAFYRSASLADPSSFDALFNLGLASAEQGDWQTALDSYERALAIDPDSVSSRYNFAQALRQADYPVDAAKELETILSSHPSEGKALLALGNLYAQRFKQPGTARQYYLKLLEVDPDNPKAAEVRFWLTAHP